MLAAVMQPTYLPWIGYFDLIDQVDVFVFYDDVQVVKGTWGVRNRIKTGNGEQYLTVPLQKTGSKFDTTFTSAALNEKINWMRKHINAVRTNYSKAPNFKNFFPVLESWYENQYESLAELNIAFIKAFMDYLGIDTPTVRSSEMDGLSGVKDERLVVLLDKINCEEYLSPPGAMGYINRDKVGGVFAENNVKLYYHNYDHQVYPQLYGDFISHLCIVDLLMNQDKEMALDTIRKGRLEKTFYLDA